MRNLEKVNALVSNGWVVLPIGTREPLTIACGPLVEQGTINHARYEIGCRYPPKSIPIEDIITKLSTMCKVKEVVLGNVAQNNTSIPVSKGGFTAYVAFGNASEAIGFHTVIEVEEKWCNYGTEANMSAGIAERGHTAEYHDKLME